MKQASDASRQTAMAAPGLSCMWIAQTCSSNWLQLAMQRLMGSTRINARGESDLVLLGDAPSPPFQRLCQQSSSTNGRSQECRRRFCCWRFSGCSGVLRDGRMDSHDWGEKLVPQQIVSKGNSPNAAPDKLREACLSGAFFERGEFEQSVCKQFR